SFVRLRRRTSAKLRDDRLGDNLRRAFGEDTRLRRADAVHVADRVDARYVGLEGLLVDRHPIVWMRREPGLDDDLRNAVHRDAEKQRVWQLAAVAQHRDLPIRIKRLHEVV